MFDWKTKIAAWFYGIDQNELNQLDQAMPSLSKLLSLFNRAKPLIDEAKPLVEEAYKEIVMLEPVFSSVIDILKRHKLAGTDGLSEIKVTLQSAYPPNRTNDEVIESVNTNLSKEEIKLIQFNLTQYGFRPSIDGKFGPETLKMVRQFQEENGLTVDGYPGKVTQAVLKQKR